ncbi:MAG: hypothetical protein PSV46_12320, partial [Reyranella sp.]|nr:hypothetical protein [Reyranella sp.]
ERIRNQIYSWIYDNGSPITSIYFDTTEIGAGNKKSADIQVVNTQGRILLNTPIHRADDLGEENDGAE